MSDFQYKNTVKLYINERNISNVSERLQIGFNKSALLSNIGRKNDAFDEASPNISTPSLLEYLLVAWIFSFIVEEINEVSFYRNTESYFWVFIFKF